MYDNWTEVLTFSPSNGTAKVDTENKVLSYSGSGRWTGVYLKLLDENGKQNIKDLKKTTKLTDKNLYAALGWLAREGKIVMETVEKDIFISLD